MSETAARATQLETVLIDLERTVAACSASQAIVRGDRDSRTVAALVNHVADWLAIAATLMPQAAPGESLDLSEEVVAELDARLAKSAAARDWAATIEHLRASIAELQRSLQILGERASEAPVERLVGRYAIEHVVRHTAAIKSALEKGSRDPPFGQDFPALRGGGQGGGGVEKRVRKPLPGREGEQVDPRADVVCS